MKAGLDPEAFGRRLKAALVLADMTASQLAAEVGDELEISRATIERVMQGRRAPKAWEIARFAAALGVTRNFLERGIEERRDGDAAELRDLEARRHDELMRRLDSIDEQLRTLATTARDRARS